VIENLLFDYNKKQGTTLIIVTHDPELASKCDIQIYIKDGNITAIKHKKTAKKGAA
jgi:putative ABC transport system ATP-binding protein